MSIRAEVFGLIVFAHASDPDRRTKTAPADVDLIDRCRRGERPALDEMFRAHANSLERLLSRLVGPRADAEDLLQETFSAAMEAFPRFRGEASVKTWLHRIAVNVVHKHLRQPRHRREVMADDQARSSLSTPAEDLAQREELARLYEHLDAIDARKRIALLLHVVDDLSIAEVAALTGATRAATKSRIFWARRALLKRLAGDPAFGGRS